MAELTAFAALAPNPVVFVLLLGPIALFTRWMMVFSNPRNTPARLRQSGYLRRHPLI